MIGKRAKVGWLVSRREFQREQDDKRAWRGRKDDAARERANETNKSPEGVLFTLATSNRTVAVDPLKNGFTTCCWRSHLKIPLDIERISEKKGDTPTRRSASVFRCLVNIKLRISSRRPSSPRKRVRKRDSDFCRIFRSFFRISLDGFL